jgi:hypothetical protein
MRSYYGRMAGKEARSPTEVSPTGAAGPFQFLRSTGKQYGLNGEGFDNRFDPDASTKAMQRFTQDNIKTLTAGLGRPPTQAELALAHQQGAGTAVKMLTGTGNASANNLAVNNVAPGSSSQAAAQKIMAYYGLPNAPVGTQTAAASPREAVTSAVMAQQQQPLGAPDAAAESRFNDVVGMQRGDTGAYAYPAVASRGDIASDAPPIGITGAPGGRIGQAVGDTVQQREGIIKTLNGQPPAPEVPQQNPTLPSPATATTAGSPPEAANNRPIVMPDVQPRAAAPAPAPGAQMAQAQPPAPDYIMPKPTPPTAPPVPQMSPREAKARAALAGPDGDNPYIKRAAEGAIAEEQAKSQFEAQRAITVYNAQVQHYQALDTKYQDWLANRQKSQLELQQKGIEVGALPEKVQQEAAKRAQEIVQAKEKIDDQARFGRDPDKFFTQLDKDKATAQSSAATLEANRMALAAIRAGVVTGTMADMRINTERLKNWAWGVGLDGNNVAANTQVLRAAMTNGLGSAVKTINGEGGVGVSNTDVKLAGMASGADPNLELSAIEQLLHTSNRINARKVNEYEDKTDYYLRGHRTERDYTMPVGETAPPKYIKALMEHKDNPAEKAEFDKRFGEGTADLEIARAKRRERRGG